VRFTCRMILSVPVSLCIASAALAGPGAPATPDQPAPPDKKAAINYQKLPMSFEPNRGQAVRRSHASSRADVLRVQFMGGNRSASIEGLDGQGGTSNPLTMPVTWVAAAVTRRTASRRTAPATCT
jgi:hypothetical protein